MLAMPWTCGNDKLAHYEANPICPTFGVGVRTVYNHFHFMMDKTVSSFCAIYKSLTINFMLQYVTLKNY